MTKKLQSKNDSHNYLVDKAEKYVNTRKEAAVELMFGCAQGTRCHYLCVDVEKNKTGIYWRIFKIDDLGNIDDWKRIHNANGEAVFYVASVLIQEKGRWFLYRYDERTKDLTARDDSEYPDYQCKKCADEDTYYVCDDDDTLRELDDDTYYVADDDDEMDDCDDDDECECCDGSIEWDEVIEMEIGGGDD